MSDTYYAQHPDPDKKGTNINRAKYEQIHFAILSAFGRQPVYGLQELSLAVKDILGNSFDGSIMWYVTTVKLDMESRGELECDRSQSPHALRLT